MNLHMHVGLFMLKRENFAKTNTRRLHLLRDTILSDMATLWQQYGPILSADSDQLRLRSQHERRIAKQYQDFMFYLNQIERELRHRNGEV